MKASEFIERIQQLMEVANADPEVLLEIEGNQYDYPLIELSYVKRAEDGSFYQTLHDNNIQVLTIC
jgi:hypothetical protein